MLCIVTLLVSSYVAYTLHGSILSKVRILELRDFGGLTFEHLKNFELWGLVTSQLVHVKPIHMLFNVISLFILGCFIERIIGAVRLLLLWFVAGVSGTFVSILFVSAPYDVGTGASQAAMGFAACGVLLVIRRINNTLGLKAAIVFSIAPALALDLIYAHYPKPGHIAGFIFGLLFSMYILSKNEASKAQQVAHIKS